jgi:hypothetical protein
MKGVTMSLTKIDFDRLMRQQETRLKAFVEKELGVEDLTKVGDLNDGHIVYDQIKEWLVCGAFILVGFKAVLEAKDRPAVIYSYMNWWVKHGPPIEVIKTMEAGEKKLGRKASSEEGEDEKSGP